MKGEKPRRDDKHPQPKKPNAKEVPSLAQPGVWFAGVFGGLLGLALIKFGNPVILDRYVAVPQNGWELVLNPWPVLWGFILLAIAATVCFVSRRPVRPDKLGPSQKVTLTAAAAWYVWQWIAAIDSVEPALTRVTLAQFTACIACFAVGFFCLGREPRLRLFWTGILVGFCVMLWSAFDQRFGGLDATRRMLYEQGNLEGYPPEFLKRMASNRVFGTLFYPNALAGMILLLLPPLAVFLQHALARRSNIVFGTALGLLFYVSVACLYWSGSKGGWLIAAGMAVGAIWPLSMSKAARRWIMSSLAVLALAVFVFRFSDYFQRGATSAVARADYWQAALKNTLANPVTGSGPGTFQIPYKSLKRPESEMARLAHNDYLQQASDSGFPGFCFYSLTILGSLAILYRESKRNLIHYATWLGLAAWATQGFLEFGLYIPALSWTAFTLLGWLLGKVTSWPPGTIGST